MQTMNFRIDLRIVCGILLLIIVGMLAVWRPWSASDNERKIEVTGQAEIEAVPDEFVFYPYFERKNSDAAAAKKAIDELGNQTVKDLEALGVAADDIKLDSNSYNYDYLPKTTGDQTVSLTVTVTVGSKDLAQKVQDYLAGTDAKGQLTPAADFSDTRRREIESQVREKALADAKQKAEQLVSQLDSKLGKVLEINDADSFQPPWLYGSSGGAVAEDSSRQSLPIKPGKQTISLRLNVTFALR